MVNLTFGAIVFHSAPNKALQPTAKSAAAERSVRCLIERRYLLFVCYALKREREAQYSDSGVGR